MESQKVPIKKMDDWGYPHLRKPPYRLYHLATVCINGYHDGRGDSAAPWPPQIRWGPVKPGECDAWSNGVEISGTS